MRLPHVAVAALSIELRFGGAAAQRPVTPHLVSTVKKAPVGADGDVASRPTAHPLHYTADQDRVVPKHTLRAGHPVRVTLTAREDIGYSPVTAPAINAIPQSRRGYRDPPRGEREVGRIEVHARPSIPVPLSNAAPATFIAAPITFPRGVASRRASRPAPSPAPPPRLGAAWRQKPDDPRVCTARTMPAHGRRSAESSAPLGIRRRRRPCDVCKITIASRSVATAIVLAQAACQARGAGGFFSPAV